MPLDPRLLNQVLHAPLDVDVGESPIVTAIVLRDPANAEALVPFLDEPDGAAAVHARQILCRFDRSAVPGVMRALAEGDRSADGRASGLDVLWSILLGERPHTIRAVWREAAVEARTLLDDRRPIPDRAPSFVERDFQGRVCDRAYLVIAQSMNRTMDVSEFRASDDDARDREIRRLDRRVFGGIV